MNVLSIFDGMSCGRLALDRAGIRYDNYFASEIDPHAIKVAKSNYPDTIQLGDVCGVTADRLPKIDLLFGGSPCQGFSVAGKGLNFDDPRSRLFFEFVRLKNELQPRYFLLENVPMKKAWRDIISQHLGVEPIVINSARVSAQNRVRYYWTNIRAAPFYLFGNVRSTIGQPPDSHILLKDILEPDADPKYTLHGKRLRFMLARVGKYTQVGGEKSMTQTARMDSGWQGSIITMPRGNNKGKNEPSKKCGTFTGSSFEHNNFLKLDTIGNLKKNQTKASCFTAWAHSGGNHSDMDIISDGQLYRRLTPVEVERLQTVPDNYTAFVSDSQRYRMLGNGWTVDVIAWILSHIQPAHLSLNPSSSGT